MKSPMGFALWVDRELAWAQGTHEYRPMGCAVIASTALFAPRDFSPRRPCPLDRRAAIGLFASIGEMNRFLRQLKSQSQLKKKKFRPRVYPYSSII
jgi:hypothetical protein